MTTIRSFLLGPGRSALVASGFLCAGIGSAQPMTFTHLAGSVGSGWFDGTGSAAQFHDPGGVAVDGTGNVYVADSLNHTIRKVAASGSVTTLAGLAGSFGSADGTGREARFARPNGVAVDVSGNVYVADQSNGTIRKVTASGVVTTLAGLAGSFGSADGTGSAARFNSPDGVAVDGAGTVYVTDRYNHTIRKVTPSGEVTTLAGMAGNGESLDGTGSAARFWEPHGIAVDGSGNAWVTDGCDDLRKVTPAGVVTTLANGVGCFWPDMPPGPPAAGSGGVAVDASGNAYVAEGRDHTIWKVTASGVVTTLAGLAGRSGSADGTGSEARFNYPGGLAVGPSGNVYVADRLNSSIRKVKASGVVTTLAGPSGRGSADGTGNRAQFSLPSGVAVDDSGNVYVADQGSDTIRKVTASGAVTTLAGLAGTRGAADGTGSEARFSSPSGVAVDGSGNVYVADQGNDTIRKVTASGAVTTLAGLAGKPGDMDGTGSGARFNAPRGVAVDGSGSVYVADEGNHTVRKVTASGVVTTLAALAGYSSGVAVDGSGNVYLVNESGRTIRKALASGVVTTLAGLSGAWGCADGTGNGARFSEPSGVAVDGSGNVYVTDQHCHTVRRVTPAGMVTTLAGLAENEGSADGTGSEARFRFPSGIAVDGSGNVYVADRWNDAIRKGTDALLDVATIDSPTGPAGSPRTLGSSPRTASSWLWEVVRRPVDSTAKLSAADVATPTFAPDRPGLYTFLLTASDGVGSRNSMVDLTATGAALPAPDSLWVAAGMAWADGLNGERWQSDLSIHNPGTQSATYSLAFVSGSGWEGAANAVWSTLEVGAGETRTFPNILAGYFGLARGAWGVVLVRGESVPASPVLVSRTYNAANAEVKGTFGLSVPAIWVGEGVRPQSNAAASVLADLRHDASFRTNLTVANLEDETAEVEVLFRDESGSVLGSPAKVTVEARGVKQLNAALSAAVATGDTPIGGAGYANPVSHFSAEVRLIRGSGVYPYATVIDQGTGDSIVFTPTVRPSASYRLPGIVRVKGKTGSWWVSDVAVLNPSTNTRKIRVTYSFVRLGTTNRVEVSNVLSLAPRQLSVAVDFVRNWLGLAEDDTDGYASSYVDFASAPDDPTPSEPIVVTGKTYSPSGAGSAGLQVDAFVPEDGLGVQGLRRELVLSGLQANARYRTNVALFLAPGSTGSVQVDLHVLDALGREAKRFAGLSLDASNPFLQLASADLFANLTTDDSSRATVVIDTPRGTGTVAAYATVIDNLSEDAIFVARPPTP